MTKKFGFRPMKTAERWDKRSARSGKDTSFGRIRENLPQAGDVTSDTAGLRGKAT